MKRGEVIRFLILRTIGNFLVLFAIFGVIATFGPALYFEVQYRVIQIRGVHYTVVSDQGTSFGDVLDRQKENIVKDIKPGPGFSAVLAGSKEQILTPKDTDFDILIPKVGANEKVYVNVDPVNENEFLPILQKGIAHAKGTSFPGMGGNIYLFAHSTDNFWDVGRYNAIFYLLKDIKIGDQIVMYFEDRRYNYKVTDTKIVDPTDVTHLVANQEKEETLILQTCWPPGTTWQRLLVFAKRG